MNIFYLASFSPPHQLMVTTQEKKVFFCSFLQSLWIFTNYYKKGWNNKESHCWARKTILLEKTEYEEHHIRD